MTKSGTTTESIYLVDQLEQHEGIQLWLLSYSEHSSHADVIENKIIIKLEHKFDLWNIIPDYSTTLNFIILQKVTIESSKRMELELERNFKSNHPGGATGVFLKHN